MKDFLKLVICWAAALAALVLNAVFINVLHLSPLKMPGNTLALTQLLLQLLSGAVLVLGLYSLARSLAAPPQIRVLVLAIFLYGVLGVNNVIEGKFFTHFFDGKVATVTLCFLVTAVLVGGTTGWLFGKDETAPGLARHSLFAWTARLGAAWLSWPLVYLIFGMCVAPIVVPYYRASVGGLELPHLSTLLAVQLLRSAIFLAISLPFLALWKGSRLGLWLALGLAHAVVVGLYGLVGSTFFPMVLRVAHGAEMTADGFAYAGILVLLFAAPAAVKSAPVKTFNQPHPLPL
jgi:hypothetical protein